ncbi:MAG: Lrp/AsnC family transcriptional regulator [Chloroflexi bacterium]|nr:Lrp/AsnC family transcriptional regulator [Chloroflexota bacterium]
MTNEYFRTELDEIDLGLIRELQANPRQSNREMASRLGINAATVSRRLRRLREERVIHVVGIATRIALGYHTSAFIAINVEAGRIDFVVDNLASLPEISNMDITAGRYDILAWVTCRDLVDFHIFLTKKLGAVSGIRDTEVMIVLKNVKFSFGLAVDNMATSPKDLDPLDLALIKELEIDGRLNNSHLAKRLHISWRSVRSRLDRLVSEGVLQFAAIPSRYPLGYAAETLILIKAELSRIDDVAQIVARFDEVETVVVAAGRFQIIAWASFRDPKHIYGFLRSELGAIQGIVSYETLISLGATQSFPQLLSHDRQPLRWKTPAVAEKNRRQAKP